MKLFNKTDNTQSKIISTDDIAIVKNNEILDDSLTDIIDNQQNDINDLKSNVKWLYKYGGVGGTGGGTGPGDSSKYGVIIMIDDNAMYENIILDKNKVNHKLTIRISNHKQKNYRFRYKLTSESAYSSSYRTFPTSNNDWEFNTNVTLTKNSKLSVEVRNEDDVITIVEYNYILNPFTLSADIYDNNNNKIITTNILLKNYKLHGLNYIINYDISVDATVYYKILCNNSVLQNIIDSQITKDENDKCIITEKQGQIKVNLYDLLQNENAGQYLITTTVYVDQPGKPVQEFPFTNTFYLIPEDLYLVINSDKNYILYNNQQENYLNDDSNVDFFQSGMNTIIIKPYNNNSTSDKVYISGTYSYYDNTINDWVENEIINNDIVIAQNIKQVAINFYPYSDKTEYKLKFTAKLGQNAEQKEFIKYVYVKKSNENYTWYGNRIVRENDNVRIEDIYPGAGIYYKLTRVDKYGNNININNIDLKNYDNKQYINVYSNNKHNISLLSNKIDFGAAQTVVLNIGIQLSFINDDNVNILKVNYLNGNTTETLEISQSCAKIIINNQTDSSKRANVYIPKEKEYNPNDTQKYHLLTIVSRAIDPNNNNDNRSELICYIDGVIEGAFYSSLDRNSFFANISSIELLPANYSINLFELSYFNLIFSDIYISNYYNTYNKLTNTNDSINDNKEIIDSLMSEGLTVTSNNLLEISYNVISILAEKSDIPLLMLSYNDNLGYDFFNDWFLPSYKEEDKITPITVNATWICHEKFDDVNPISIKTGNVIENNEEEVKSADFSINIQGSSTRAFSIKNLSLSINTPADETNNVYVFSPNFKTVNSSMSNDEKNECYNTFLPEETFTLKADVSDSSHRNNTSIGAFVNDNTTKFADATINIDSSYKNYIKNCLLGFPIILIFEKRILDANGAIVGRKYYYMGIYNFNLGRDSYFNLGYIPINKPNLFSNDTLISPEHQEIKIYKINNADNQILDSLCVAEVQGNRPEFDFSQFDDSILFKQGDLDAKYMFGDIKTAKNQDNNGLTSIREFTKGVAYLGGYFFKFIGKNFSDNIEDNFGYKDGYSAHLNNNLKESINQVPNFQYQCKKDINDEFKLKFDENNKKELGINTNDLLSDNNFSWGSRVYQNIMNFYLGYHDTVTDEIKSPGIDITSLVEYYTICMGFGMTDSVQKNLNIKTWTLDSTHGFDGDDAKDKYYIAFYDMDTALGRSNKGYNTQYFAFSDYYNINATYNSDHAIISENVVRYMDFYPIPESNSNISESTDDNDYDSDGFDTPSSYLFAIAKYQSIYARFYANGNEEYENLQNISPLNIWAKFRQKDGPLRNAKYFIDNYYNKNFSKIPNVLLSLNYRLKYLRLDNTNTTLFIFHDFEALHGSGTYFVEDWLSGRLHILDMYFNLNLKEKQIYYYDKNENAWNQMMFRNNKIIDNYTISFSKTLLTENPDIYILRSMFASSLGQQYTVYPAQKTISSYIYAPYLTTTIIESTVTEANSYIFIDDISVPIFLTFTAGGEENVAFLGSVTWVDVSDLSSFIDKGNKLIINSDYLQRIILTNQNATCTDLTLANIKSVKEIKINGPKYTFDLYLTDMNLVNLDKIDLSNSKVKISQIINLNISYLNLNGLINNSNIEIKGCKNLIDINLDNLTCNSLEFDQIIKPDLELNNITCSTIDLTCDNSIENARIKISACKDLTTLVLNNFTTIEISNCPKLCNLTILDADFNESTYTNRLKRLSIIKCNTKNTNLYAEGENMPNGWNLKLNSDNNLGETKTFDLSRFSQLEYITFSSYSNSARNNDATLNFNKVILPKDNIALGASAFAYTELESIVKINGNEETHNVKLKITNGQAVFKCTPYKPTNIGGEFNSETNTFDFSGITNVSEMFATTEDTFPVKNLTLSDYNNIIKNLIDTNNNNVKIMTKMFYGQSKMNVQYNNNDINNINFESLSSFTNVSNIDQIFDGTGINIIPYELFNSGDLYIGKDCESSFSMKQFISGRSIDIHENAFINLLSKIESLEFKENTLITLYKVENNVKTSVEYAANLFKDVNNNNFITNNIKTIKYLNFNVSSYNVENLFEAFNSTYNDNTKLEISSCFINGNIPYEGINNTKLNEINKELKVTNSFNNISSPIEIYKLFNWSNLSNECDFLSENSNVSQRTESLMCAKTINDYTDENGINEWNEIWAKLSRFTMLKNIFYTCTIKSKIPRDGGNIYTDNAYRYYELKMPELGSTYNINTTKLLFSKLDVTDITDLSEPALVREHIPIKLTKNTFKYLNSIKVYQRMFKDCKLYNNLPLNLFNKANSTNNTNIVKLKTADNEIINITGNANLAIYESYTKDITDLSYMFDNVKLINKTYFDVKEVLNSITNENALIDYIDKNIIEFYNTDLTEDNGISNAECYKDMFNLNGNYKDIPFTVQENTSTRSHGNIKLKCDANNISKVPVNLFTAPDLLYACDTRCNLQNMFANSGFEGILPKHFFSKLNNNGDDTNYCLQNMLQNVTIIPNKIGEYKFVCPSIYTNENNDTIYEYKIKQNNIYTFIPENFSTLSKIYNYTGFFNFNLLIPQEEHDSDNSYNTYYIMLSNSLTDNSENDLLNMGKLIINSMPNNIAKVDNNRDGEYNVNNTEQGNISCYTYGSDSSQKYYAVIDSNNLLKKHKIHFNIMFDKHKLETFYDIDNLNDIIVEENNGSQTIVKLNTDKLFEYDGIQSQYFGSNYAKIYNFITPISAEHLYGYLLSPSVYTESNVMGDYTDKFKQTLISACTQGNMRTYLSCYALFNCSDINKQYYRQYISFVGVENGRSPINDWQGLLKYNSQNALYSYNAPEWNQNSTTVNTKIRDTHIGVKFVTDLRNSEEPNNDNLYCYQYSIETIMNMPYNENIMNVDSIEQPGKYNFKLINVVENTNSEEENG